MWHRTGAFGVPGALPFAGGYAEQPAALMRCLHHMAAIAAALDPKKSRKSEG